jgi:hypothetical protein
MKTLDGGRKKRPGRRTLCTPEKTKELCKFISGACTIKTSCEACGVSEKSFHEWIARAAAGEQPFAQFCEALTRAKGQGKAKLVKSIIDSGDWRAWLEMLARVYPSEYARTEPRVIIVQQPPAPPMPPPTTLVTREWTKDVNIPPELTRYLDVLQRTESISTRAKVLGANNNGEEKAK